MIIPEFQEIEGSKMAQPNNLIDQHVRYFIYRKTPSADVIANINNQLQERTEEQDRDTSSSYFKSPESYHSDCKYFGYRRSRRLLYTRKRRARSIFHMARFIRARCDT